MIVAADGSGESQPLLADPRFSEANAEISPDGRWVAYDSDQSGRPEVYVRTFPDVEGRRWQISAEGGSRPLWARSGNELFFQSTSSPRRLMRVPILSDRGFRHGRPQPLFDLTTYETGATGRQFDISTDGNRFIMLQPLSGLSISSSMVIVTHWFDELRAKMDAGEGSGGRAENPW